jgi:glyceraldehyde 3-phosphate dehydrogenase
MKPELVILRAIYEPAIADLERDFTVHRLWTINEPEAFLHNRGTGIRVAVTTTPHGFSRRDFERLPGLELLSCFGPYYTLIDRAEAKRRGVVVTHTPDSTAEPVADLAMGLIIAVMRRLCESDRFVRAGKWAAGVFPAGVEVRGKSCGIIGFGRIGRQVHRAAKQQGVADLEFVAINDLTNTATLAHLFKYDSVHGRYDGEVTYDAESITIDGDRIRILAERDPAKLGWGDMGVEIVLESTGRFTVAAEAKKHMDAGAKKVIISAPATNEDITIVMGVNSDKYDPASHHIISNASCTTNCLVPMVKIIRDNFGFVHGSMVTIHSYTNDQSILDLPHTDLRRARAAAVSMIPTTTGAAKATALVIPEVKGKIDGIAVRVPTPDVSLTDLTCVVERKVTKEEVNAAFKNASKTSLLGVLGYSEVPLVSIDYVGDPHSCTLDALSTIVIDGTLVKISGWYDNEWGYSSRCVDLLRFVGARL